MKHGHVIPNADGSLARCGGPALCKVCAQELNQLKRGENLAKSFSDLVEYHGCLSGDCPHEQQMECFAEIYQQGRADEREAVRDEITKANQDWLGLNKYAIQRDKEVSELSKEVHELTMKLYGPKFCKNCNKVQPVITYKLNKTDFARMEDMVLTAGFIGSYSCSVCHKSIEVEI